MHERDLEPEHPLARLAVDQLGAPCSEVGRGSAHVVDLVSDVVHSRPARCQKLADRRICAERRQQLDPAVTDPDRRRLDALSVHTRAVFESTTEKALICAHRLVKIRNGDPDVVDSPCFHAVDATAASL